MRKHRRGHAGVLAQLGRLILRGAQRTVAHPRVLIGLGVAAIGIGALGFGLTHSEAFRVTTVQVPLKSAFTVPPSLMGQNLWTVDLKTLADELKAQHPSLKRVRVIRVPPNTLQVETLPRTPVAQVRLGQWHAVDADGFLFADGSQTPWDTLVILRGVDTPKAPLRVGREQTNERLRLALRVVNRLKRSSVLLGHQVTDVDVSNPSQLVFTMDGDVEVRCGSEESLGPHLDRLREVLRRVSRHQVAVRYIDVRFTDPVVSPQR